MTWIKTIGMDEDERVKKAMMDQRALYPAEYFTPVPIVDRGPKESITASHSLIPDAMFHSFSAFGAMMAPDLPSPTPPARNDRHDGVGHEPVPLLNRVTRRVSA